MLQAPLQAEDMEAHSSGQQRQPAQPPSASITAAATAVLIADSRRQQEIGDSETDRQQMDR
jgi:hypothetical protein